MSLKFSYSLIAPLYDTFLERASAQVRIQSLAQLPQQGTLDILINGIGTGLDIPYLPLSHRYTGIDLTAAMLKRALKRRGQLQLNLVQGDSLALPFANERFDHAVLHLILAVVPQPLQCLKEIARVLKPGGSVLILDKFLKPGETAFFRRLLNIVSSRVATRMDVVFEEVLAGVPQLKLESDVPVLANGWFRSIRLLKAAR